MKRYITKKELTGETFSVAKNIILGAYLSTEMEPGVITTGIITEVEVYIGGSDKASHSYNNKKTSRTQCQFEEGGLAYIFTVYGIHTQFCIVTNKKNISDVVLIRAIEPVNGIEIMKDRRNIDDVKKLTVGPGNVCKALGITKEQYGIPINSQFIYLYEGELSAEYRKHTVAAKRIGIDYAGEDANNLWRFYNEVSAFVRN